MKNKKRILTGLLAAALVVPLFVGSAQTAAAAEAAGKTLDVVFTHDTHSHLNSFSTVIDGESTEVGGFARIKTVIDEQKAENPDTLVVDGGDFSMGTLVQTVYEDEAAELRMLGAIGCEVTTFGNHEFDYRSSGLAQMLKSAAESGDVLPELVVCNVDWDAMEAAGLNDGQQQIQSGFEEYGVKDYVVLQKSLHQNLIARVKILGQMDIAEKRLPQDGHFRTRIANRDVNIRTSVIPTVFGEKETSMSL